MGGPQPGTGGEQMVNLGSSRDWSWERLSNVSARHPQSRITPGRTSPERWQFSGTMEVLAQCQESATKKVLKWMQM